MAAVPRCRDRDRGRDRGRGGAAGEGFPRRGLSGCGGRAGRAAMPPSAMPLLLLPLLLAALAVPAPGTAAVAGAGGCGPCDAARCPALPARGCPLGRVRDGCGCCWQCGRGEGEACGGGGAAGGRCAPGLECVKSRQRRKAKGGPVPAAAAAGPPGVCLCKSRYPVCGSDGLTYGSGCQLRAASLRAQSRGEPAISQRSKGACEQGAGRAAGRGRDGDGRAAARCHRANPAPPADLSRRGASL